MADKPKEEKEQWHWYRCLDCHKYFEKPYYEYIICNKCSAILKPKPEDLPMLIKKRL